jgi:hypothetical protein
MSKESVFPNKGLLIWISANILCFAALGVLLLAFPSLMSISGFVPTYLIISIPIGLAQWLALRHILRMSALWIFTLPVGVMFAALFYRIAPYGLRLNLDDESILALTSGYFVLGFSIGLPQWLMLRRQLAKSSIWLLSSSIAVAAGFWLVLITDLINQSGMLSAIVVVFIYPTITGLALAWLIANHNSSYPKLNNAG